LKSRIGRFGVYPLCVETEGFAPSLSFKIVVSLFLEILSNLYRYEGLFTWGCIRHTYNSYPPSGVPSYARLCSAASVVFSEPSEGRDFIKRGIESNASSFSCKALFGRVSGPAMVVVVQNRRKKNI